MAVSKRLRYEILRRDNHACRYCGAAAPDVNLTVDHVVPQALGGSDDPSNLVAACIDCNAGKSASTPDASLVADVEQDALRWSVAMQRAAEIERRDRIDDDQFVSDFIDSMISIFRSDESRYEMPVLPSDVYAFHRSILIFRDAGLDMSDLSHAIGKAMSNRRLTEDRIWKYFCGIAWRMIEDRQKVAYALLEEADDAE